MKKYNIGILGATGMVGREMLKILEERNLPIGVLRLFASEKSVGKKILFKGKNIEVESALNSSFEGLDYLLGAVNSKLSRKIIPLAVDQGVVVVDNSSAFRLEENVPLVIPEINKEDLEWHSGIVANPNCSTIIALMAVKEINKLSKIKRMTVSTYQAVSGAGIDGMETLLEEVRSYNENHSLDDCENCDFHEFNSTGKNSPFPQQIAFNAIAKIGDFCENGYTQEEMKLQNEGRKILHNSELKVSCTCVRIPVLRSHSEAIAVETQEKIDINKLKAIMRQAEGIVLYDESENYQFPTPLMSSNQDKVLIGRVREDESFKNSISLWCCGDQIRKGAATNAIEIVEELINRNKYKNKA